MTSGAVLLASTLWSSLNALAAAFSSAGLPSRRRLPCRVISVGNLQAGGSGKTPLVIRIAREAVARGLKPAILSRGYGGRWEKSGGVILSGEPTPPVADCGDEVALMHEQVPEASIGVGSDRVRGFESLVGRAGSTPDLVILDDGFQNRSLHKDVEVLAVTSSRRRDRIFREFPGAIRRADLVVWTKGGSRPDSHGRPSCRVLYRVRPPAEPKDCLLVTGVGDPYDVRALLTSCGYAVREHLSLPDHAGLDAASAGKVAASARERGLALLMTGKDWVKWREQLKVEALVVEPELEFAEGREEWERILWGS